MNFENWFLFASIAFIAAATPGPAVLLISANSISYGVKKSIFTILGNIVGLFVMSLLSILGLSAIILNSATVFLIVKIIGSLYLVYLGIKIWRNGFGLAYNSISSKQQNMATPKPYRLFVQGLFVALSNPKAIAFTTALFPQFIQPELSLVPQFLILISTFMLLSFSWLFTYALLATKTKHHAKNPFRQKMVGKIFGTIFIGSGVALAAASQKL